MEVTRTFGTTATLFFPLIDAGTADFESTPVTFASGDTQVSIDGGAFANTGSNPSHEGNGIYSLAMTALEMAGTVIVVTVIDQTATKAWEDQSILANTQLGFWAEGGKGIIIGEVDTATEASTTTTLEAFRIAPNTTESTVDDFYNGRLITFTTGNLTGQQTDITDFTNQNSKERYTFSTLTAAPDDASRFVVT